MGKDFIGIVVKENADSIIRMDNHNAESYSEQQQQYHQRQLLVSTITTLICNTIPYSRSPKLTKLICL